MGIPSRQHDDPRYRAGARGRADRGQAPARLCQGRRGIAGGVILAALVFCAAAIPGLAETLRIATYHTELSRKGPGLLLRDILRGEDAQVEAVAQVVGAVSPDILILQGVDYDRDLLALAALRDVIAKTGPHYPHLFALRPNTGLASGLDVDGDGKLGEPEDAQG